MIFFGILDRLKAKYIFSGALLLLFLLPVLGMALPGGVQHPATPERQTPPDSTPTQAVQKSRRETRREIRRLQREADRPPTAETRTEEEQDSLFDTRIDSIFGAPPLSPIAPADSTAPTGNDSLLRDSLRQDTTQRDTTRKKSFLDDIISGKNQDSLYYDVRNRTVYIYNQGDINYQNMNLKGDFMRVNMDEKIIYAHGKRDTIDGKPTVTNPTFTEGAANPYTMDTITYNIGSKKAKIKGVATQEGDGWLIGNNVKKMDDNTIHIQDGKDGPPPLLPGDDQGEGDSRQESGHGSRLPGPGRRSHLLSAAARGFLPAQFRPQVGSADADFRRGIDQGILHP